MGSRGNVAGSRNLLGTEGEKYDLDFFRSPDTKLTTMFLLVAEYQLPPCIMSESNTHNSPRGQEIRAKRQIFNINAGEQ
jgi:hypothetical protein